MNKKGESTSVFLHHVIVKSNKTKEWDVWFKDLSILELQTKFLEKYSKSKDIFNNGKILKIDDINELIICRTQDSIKNTISNINDELFYNSEKNDHGFKSFENGDIVFGLPPEQLSEWQVKDNSENVTDKFITSTPGSDWAENDQRNYTQIPKKSWMKIILNILGTILIGVFLIHYEFFIEKIIDKPIETSQHSMIGEMIFSKIYLDEKNYINDEKFKKITKRIVLKFVHNLSEKKDEKELDSLKLGTINPTIEYLKIKIKSTDDIGLLSSLLAELATLEYLNNNKSIALKLYKESFELVDNPDVLYQLKTLENYLLELTEKEKTAKESQVETIIINNSSDPVQQEETPFTQEISIIQDSIPLFENYSTVEGAPLSIRADEEIISISEPTFGTVSFKNISHQSAIVYTPNKNYHNSCDSLNERDKEKDHFTYIMVNNLEITVYITVTCISNSLMRADD